MNIGSYVRQHVCDNSSGTVWRYGIVVNNNMDSMSHESRACYKAAVRVVFSPRKDHPVGAQPYAEYVESTKLEVISD